MLEPSTNAAHLQSPSSPPNKLTGPRRTPHSLPSPRHPSPPSWYKYCAAVSRHARA
jgi:hypothetical protein